VESLANSQGRIIDRARSCQGRAGPCRACRFKIVRTITRRIGDGDAVKPGQEMLFLNAFYRAQREHLESLKLFGKLREDKYHAHAKTEAKKLV
jgi:hypothetical protein